MAGDLAVEAGAFELLVNTPDKSLMEEHAQEVMSEYLAGAGKFGLDNANLEDSTAYMENVIANIAKSKGKNLSVAQIKELTLKPFSEMSDREKDYYLDAITVSSAQTGVNVAGEVSGNSYHLYSVSSGVLQDGRLTFSEAVNLGATAVSMSSSFMAGFAGGAAFGPIGAIAGIVIGGINILSSERSADRAMKAAREAEASRVIEAMIQYTDEYLDKSSSEYYSKRSIVWESRDSAIAEVSDAWATFEENLGVRFGLRYFPGSPAPPRAGFYERGYKSSGAPIIVKQRLCDTPSGCLYFPEPHPDRVSSLGLEAAFQEMLQQMSEDNKYLTSKGEDLSHLLTGEDYELDPNYQGLDYYNRAIRACNSFMPDPDFKYWVPRLKREDYRAWRSAGDIAWEWFCGRPLQVPGCSRQPRYSCFESLDCRYTRAQQQSGILEAKKWVSYKPLGGHKNEPDFPKRAQQFVQDMYDKLSEFDNSTDVIKTRVIADLVSTANAVNGELSTSVRLNKLFQEMGASSISDLTQADARNLHALSPEVRKSFDRAATRNSLVNNTVLAAGAGAAGFGAYKKWGKR